MRFKRITALALAAALAFSIFTGCTKKPGQNGSDNGTTNPRPVVNSDYNLLTGLPKEKDCPTWQRPVALMVNNHKAALPQRGIGSADVIYEMVTEGGITRLMAVFTDYKKLPQVGPIRSMRDQHLQFALPLNPIFVHIGTSIYTENMLRKYSFDTINGVYCGPSTFWFDTERFKQVGQEHCWYTDAERVAKGIEATGLSDQGGYGPLFSFAEKATVPQGNSVQQALNIQYRYSSYTDAMFSYDSSSSLYLKSEYGSAQIDGLTGEQLGFTNVFLLFTTVTLRPDGLLTEFDLTSGGNGFYYTAGCGLPITWTKAGPDSPLKLYGPDGSELKVNPGKSYIGVANNSVVNTLQVQPGTPAEAPAVSQ